MLLMFLEEETINPVRVQVIDRESAKSDVVVDTLEAYDSDLDGELEAQTWTARPGGTLGNTETRSTEM